MMTVLLGCLIFLGWLLLTRADRTSISILRDSMWNLLLLPFLLAIPLGVVIAMGELAIERILGPAQTALLPLIAIVVFEELIKLRASQLRESGIQVFAYVSLFGIFELTFFKFLYFWDVSGSATELIWAQLSALPPVAMHTLTAAIYAFHCRQNPLRQFAICAVIHIVFNLLAGSVADQIWLASIVPITAATLWLIPKRGTTKRGEWLSDETLHGAPR